MKKLLYILLAISLMGCDDFLDAEPSKSTAKKIESAKDLDLLLNEYNPGYRTPPDYFNTDNFVYPIEVYDAQPVTSSTDIENYLFETKLSELEDVAWNERYESIWLYNQVINSLNSGEITGDESLKKQLKAEAHFLRATCYFALALNYCLHPTDANADEMGLPLRTKTDYEENMERASLKETYEFIEADLVEGLKLDVPYEGRVWRASTGAVKAFAARYYLYVGDFVKAGQYADEALQEYSGMIDYASTFYDTPSGDLNFPNDFFTFFTSTQYMDLWTDQYMLRCNIKPTGQIIPTQELLDLYDPKDERYEHFVIENMFSSGGLEENPFDGYAQNVRADISGPSTAEMYLIRAETKARNGDIAGAMADVENVRTNRFAAENYTALAIPATKKEAIQEVIDERRREMPFAIRWYDIRRINVDSETDNVTLRRRFYPINESIINNNVDPVEITIEPNSRLYARPIGNDIIILSNGQTKQNTY